jgi:PEP-CTERM motif
MKSMFKILSFAAILAVAAAPAAHATEVFNSGLGGPGVYFGSGNPDCCFAVNTGGTVELGLKASIRGVANAIIPSGMDYSVPPGHGAPPNSTGDVLWNFDFSVNTGSAALDAYTYLITITDDQHPALTHSFDPDPATLADDAIASSSGTCNGPTKATPTVPSVPCAYNPATDNGFQNSENIGFGFLPGFNVNSSDSYTITLTATGAGLPGGSLTDTIDVVPTPEPSSLVFLGTGLVGVAGKLIRRRRAA